MPTYHPSKGWSEPVPYYIAVWFKRDGEWQDYATRAVEDTTVNRAIEQVRQALGAEKIFAIGAYPLATIVHATLQ